MKRTLLTLTLVTASFTFAQDPQTKITIDHNSLKESTSSFRFKRVPSPVKDNAATKAKLSLVVGTPDPKSGGLKAVVDGDMPQNDYDPSANFFYVTGSDGGRLLMDMGSPIAIAQVNTYSWNAYGGGPQVYNLFVSDGTAAGFNPAPDEHTDPATCGWKLVATVDTRPRRGDVNGQYGVSITTENGALGKYRYLLFDSIPAEDEDPWGNTYFSKINVIASQQ